MDYVQFGLRSFQGNAAFQAGHYLDGIVIVQSQSGMHKHRQDDVGGLAGGIPAKKMRRRDADKREGRAGQGDGLANSRWIAPETPIPVPVADHRQGLAPRLVILRTKRPAGDSMDTQDIEIVS